MRHVEIQARPLGELASLLPPARAEALLRTGDRARALLAGRVVWNVNATASGGGVAEMLQTLLAYGRGAGVNTRWLVLTGDPAFFTITKRLHNLLHGGAGDGGPLGDAERAHYDGVLDENLATCRGDIRPGDIVLLHDPQTAGLAAGMAGLGAHPIWRSHIGRDTPNALTDRGWAFLRPLLGGAEGFIFSRPQYVPSWLDRRRVWVIPPSIDPFSAKNQALDPATIHDTLVRAGLVRGMPTTTEVRFERRDGATGVVGTHHLIDAGARPTPEARLVVQVSRWDQLKDMAGVLEGFVAAMARLASDVHLVLAGPEVGGVSDDPEGGGVLNQCRRLWGVLPARARDRIHLVSLPMHDVNENAVLVNALQRHASVVVQKSLVEGFGLTVTEGMWKGRPVVASAVGGILDQIQNGREGLLLAPPTDLPGFGQLLREVLHDPVRAGHLGTAARQRARDHFIGDRHLIQYADLFGRLLVPGGAGT